MMRRLLILVLLPQLFLLLGCVSANMPPAQDLPAGTRSAAHLMVTLKDAPPGRLDLFTRELAESYGLEPVASWQVVALSRRCVVFGSRGLLEGRRLENLLRSLRADPRIDLAQPVQHFAALSEAAAVAAGGSYRNLQHGADALHLEAAHLMATGSGVKVAVVDTGVDLTHPELSGRILAAKDFAARRLKEAPRGEEELFTRDLHGTAVAGVIAAADDGKGILGVAPAAGLLVLKACWAQAPGERQAICDSYTLALAIDFALGEGAQVINLSWSGPPDPILEALVEVALARGIVVVAALGAPGGFPALVPGVISVRSLEGGEVADQETSILAAPGEEILTTVPGGGYDFFSGSSLATAQVSGIAALALEIKPEIGPHGLAELLRRTAHDNPGRAAVDACAPLAALLGRSCDR